MTLKKPLTIVEGFFVSYKMFQKQNCKTYKIINGISSAKIFF